MSSALPSMMAWTKRPRWLRADVRPQPVGTGDEEEQPDDADHEQEQPLPGEPQPEHREHEVDEPGHEGRRSTAVGAPERHRVDDDGEAADQGHRERRPPSAARPATSIDETAVHSRMVAVANSAKVGLPMP